MKRLLLALALAFCGLAARSGALTASDARRAAERFLASADGQLAYKDVSVRFSSATAPEPYPGGFLMIVL